MRSLRSLGVNKPGAPGAVGSGLTSFGLGGPKRVSAAFGEAGKIEAVVTQPIDVTGKLDPVELKGSANVSVRVTVEGDGRVSGMNASSTGHIKANVGTSMPHIKAGPR